MQRNNWMAAMRSPGLAALILAIGMAGCGGARKQEARAERSGAPKTATSNHYVNPAAKISPDEIDFLKSVRRNNDGDLDMARLALQKSKNEEVQAFAQKLITDSQDAEHKLDALASSKNVQLPFGAGTSDDAAEAKLKGLSGHAFDQGFIEQVVEDHKQAVSEFEKESKNATDSDVKQYASTMLPVLKEHLANAQTIEDHVGGGNSKG